MSPTDFFEQLRALASAEVEAVLGGLPGPLRDRAQALPVTYEARPSPALLDDGIEPDTLGLFVGTEFAHEESSTWPIPAQIVLFLDNIWEQSEEDEEIFCEEVRTTFLHELGHYLGLDEDELTDRGLE